MRLVLAASLLLPSAPSAVGGTEGIPAFGPLLRRRHLPEHQNIAQQPPVDTDIEEAAIYDPDPPTMLHEDLNDDFDLDAFTSSLPFESHEDQRFDYHERYLQEAAASGQDDGIAAFSSLTCNAHINEPNADCSTALSSLITSSAASDPQNSGMIRIPCNTCVYYDITNGSTLTAPGINVEGHLRVPPEANGVLNTTSLVVQGKLSIEPPSSSNIASTAGGATFTLNLHGTDDVSFYPHEDNKCECGKNETTSLALPCNLGKKAIAVLGGQLNIDALPNADSCPSWVVLKDTAESSPPPPDEFAKIVGDAETETDAITGEGWQMVEGQHPASLPFGVSKSPRCSVVTREEEVVVNDTNSFYRAQVDTSISSTCSNGLLFYLKNAEPESHGDVPIKSLGIDKTLRIQFKYRVNIPPESLPNAMNETVAEQMAWRAKARMEWAQHSKAKYSMELNGCEEVSLGDWAECSLDFTLTPHIAAWAWWRVILGFEKEGAGKVLVPGTGGNYYYPSVDYDDIQVFRVDIPKRPDVLNIGPDAANCWQAGDDVLITSAENSGSEYTTARIEEISDPDQGTIRIDTKVWKNILSQADGNDGQDYAVEVARLSRHVRFQAEADDDAFPGHGGHLIVLHTPEVAQLIRGVEISGFGQQGIQGRYPIHLHVSENVAGTYITKNVIRDSSQRCIVVHGTHNATMYDNVAFNTRGHCFMLEDGGEWDNLFERNLGCKTERHLIEESWTRSDIAEPATFLITNPRNSYIENVAAGGVHGFWYELLKRVIGPSANLGINLGVNPRSMSMGNHVFKRNVAHSNFMDGFTTAGMAYWYRTNWNLPCCSEGDINVWEDLKAYKNKFDGIGLTAKNVHIKGGVFSDNDRCINAGLGCNGLKIEGVKCTGLSNHVRSWKGPGFCHWSWGRSDPKPGFAGISSTVTYKGWDDAVYSNITFTGFQDLEHCWSGNGAAIYLLDEYNYGRKQWTNPPKFLGGSSFEGVGFDIKCGLLDSTKGRGGGEGYTNIYLNDVDGSLGPLNKPGAFLATPDRDPYGSAFANQTSHCVNLDYQHSCAMFCEGVCMRKIMIESHAQYSEHKMVITDESSGLIYKYDRTVHSGHQYEAVLPYSKYSITFEDGDSNGGSWPGNAKLHFKEEPTCAEGMDFVTEDEFTMDMPDSIAMDRCSKMIMNEDFQDGTTKGWYGSCWGLSIVNVTNPDNSTDAVMKSHKRQLSRSNIYTYIDRSCIQAGQRYRLTGAFRAQHSTGEETNAPDASISLQLSDQDQWTILESFPIASVAVVGDGSWAEFDVDFQIDNGHILPEDGFKALIKLDLTPKRDSMLVDCITMEHIGVATASPTATPTSSPTASSSATPTAQPTASLTISRQPSSAPVSLPLHPMVQAENFIEQSGTGVSGGTVVGWFDEGDYLKFGPLQFGALGETNAVGIRYAKSDAVGGWIEFRLGGPDGNIIGTFTPRYTGRRWRHYAYEHASLSENIEGIHDLAIVAQGSGGVMNLDFFSLTYLAPTPAPTPLPTFAPSPHPSSAPTLSLKPSAGPSTSSRPTSSASPTAPYTETFNLALGQPTTQSSTGWGGDASRAVDGNTDGIWANDSVSHTAGESGLSWWRVELAQSNSVIEEVVLYNRLDCCGDRMNGLEVYILDAAGNDVASQIIGTATDVNTLTFGFIEGAAVEIRKVGYIQLAEVIVNGKQRL